MIDVAPPIEQALLIGAPRKRTREVKVIGEHLDELARLVDTAGAGVAGRVVQAVEKPTNDFYIGRGKVAEVAALVAETGATMVIFDDELSPAQGKNLEEELKVRIMDRSEVILDIFALRARSAEARMQVELAQLEYLLPRLARMWTHLSRIRGGIGLRGPGETQIETDRRMIRQKIGALRKKLAEVAAHRERARSRTKERGVRSAALVGYTNAGKSSLLRALTKADAHVEDRLFATLDTQSREVVFPDDSAWQPGVAEAFGSGRPPKMRFTDTVGFIRKLPHGLVASFRATLEEALDADVLVHVVDVSHPDWEEQANVVFQALAEAGLDEGKRIVVLLNKADRLDAADREDRPRLAREHGWDAHLVSATTGEGLEAAKKALRAPTI
ncbi:MAG TPA: GTPase HflX [Gemmatimonadales bacterium]|jgi:GTP-binding protein HflX